MDCNLPSGESLARQFVLGQAYFERAFGAACQEFWLPDTFGYASQLPQLMRLAGIDLFVTQKLSWSLVNKPQVSTFHWEGLDGSTVFAHFPPADNYNCGASADEVARTARQNGDKAHVPASLMLYGHGDGGGGPAKEMLARIDRIAGAPGMPAVRYSSPQQFAGALRRLARGTRLPRWRGELYLELHQGTFTSQVRARRGRDAMLGRKGRGCVGHVRCLCPAGVCQVVQSPAGGDAAAGGDAGVAGLLVRTRPRPSRVPRCGA